MSALRKVLFWLVILALPLHGIASRTVMPSPASGSASGHMQDSFVREAAWVMAHEDVMNQSAEDRAELMADCGQLFAIVKCHLSAPCGLVAAPASHVASFGAIGAASTALIAAAPIRVDFCTGAPERPPRALA